MSVSLEKSTEEPRQQVFAWAQGVRELEDDDDDDEGGDGDGSPPSLKHQKQKPMGILDEAEVMKSCGDRAMYMRGGEMVVKGRR